MKTKQAEQKGTYLRAFRAAFPYTVPVLTGYLFIGTVSYTHLTLPTIA